MYERHGHTKTPLWYCWDGMKQRCTNSNNPDYSRYGGRGIKICLSWLHSFVPFLNWAHENGYTRGLILDRKDNNSGYFPENCRWVTPQESANNRNYTKLTTAFGETKPLTHWTGDERCQVEYATAYYRIKNGWGAEEAFLTPSLIKRK